MTDIYHAIATLRRPKSLLGAARYGQRDYDRARVIRRLLGPDAPKRIDEILENLLALEGALNDQRLAREPHYSITRHVEVMIALLAEGRACRAPLAIAAE